MVYKIGCLNDLERLSVNDETINNILNEYADILTAEYGSDRDIDNDYGGYILYAPDGTSQDEVKEIFDYTQYAMEFADYFPDTSPPVCVAVYITSCEFGVVIVMSAKDAPREFIDKKDN